IGVDLQLRAGNLVCDRAVAGEFQSLLHAFGNRPDPQLRKAIGRPGQPLYYWHGSTMDRTTQEPVFEAMVDWERRVWELFELGQTAMDPAERKAHYDGWQANHARGAPVIFITKGRNPPGVQHRVG